MNGQELSTAASACDPYFQIADRNSLSIGLLLLSPTTTQRCPTRSSRADSIALPGTKRLGGDRIPPCHATQASGMPERHELRKYYNRLAGSLTGCLTHGSWRLSDFTPLELPFSLTYRSQIPKTSYYCAGRPALVSACLRAGGS